MNRREALTAVSILLGGTIIGSDIFLSGCKTKKKSAYPNFTPEDITFLDEVSETIIPATSTPGAKAAGIGTFMTIMIKDCYDEANQKVFFEGMEKLNNASDKKFGKTFLNADSAQRYDLLTELDKEQNEYNNARKPEEPVHYFRLMKEITLLGYFTSEIGVTKALRYIAVPGRYDGDVPYKKGDKAWAT